MGHGPWAMGYGLWAMGYGLWATGHGLPARERVGDGVGLGVRLADIVMAYIVMADLASASPI